MKRILFVKKYLFLIPLLFFDFLLFGQLEMLPSQGVCAHRGAKATHPENTISAFEEAIRLGAQMIEFDVQLTKDNILVIMHDDTVDRTTNGHGLVSKLTFEEIRKLDAGSWKSAKYVGEKIPTLYDVLQIMPNNIWLNIHLKGEKKTGVEVAKMVTAENKVSQSVIACGKKAAKGVSRINSSIKICNMERLSSRTDYINETIKKGFSFLQVKSNRNDENMLSDIKKLKKNGIKVNYFHSEKKEELKELLDAGVNFVLTDNLAEMLVAFQQEIIKD
ncbi:glycerophosphodiester phosphodiesterase [Algibacter lectus]|uniref:Glycerophosphoryl diester phosphodiesterase n=1 Tax=Algibacter lectus TaxID=221126 RepID=A0A090VJD1_9FLAO|nr:glycerophosphodiester phosphodiesterase family protein [Algibacter lectus]GAL64865.1 glycerophosphoryl diester phosphodiesterase [Algibacter lectus]